MPATLRLDLDHDDLASPRKHFRHGLLGVLCLFVALSACDAHDREESSLDDPRHDPNSSHARMVARLNELAGDPDNPYFGSNNDRVAEGALEQLEALGDRGPIRRWRAHYLLGWLFMREGRNEEAARHLTEAEALLPMVGRHLRSGNESNPRFDQVKLFLPGKETEFELGLAWLRVAEATNCVDRHTCESCVMPIRGGGVHSEQEPGRKAMKWFLDVLSRHPGDLTTRWLLNVAAMAVSEYPQGVPLEYRLPEDALDSDAEFPRFQEIAGQLGLDNPDLAGGAVIDDFDLDGDLDVITSSIDLRESLHYMRNDDGHFTDCSVAAGLTGITGGLNLVHADYDNDGDLDLYVLRGAWWGPHGRHPNSLIRNEGNGTFTDVTYDAGLADPAFPGQTGAFADYDNDGDLDLYVGNESMRSFACPSQLFRNEGDGTFTDVALTAGVQNLRFAKGVVWGDFDGDRYPDIYVSNLWDDNRLYRNNQDGTFTDVAPTLGVTDPYGGFATWFLDYDNDGVLDIYAAAYWNHVSHAVASYFGERTEAEASAIYRGDGNGGFVNVTERVGLADRTLPMGANFGDLDNDGYPDFYLGTGYPSFEAIVPNRMYWNREGRRFDDVTTAGGFGHLQKGHGVVFADIDGDGDQDVFEQMGGVFRSDGFGDILFENPGFGHHWMKVSLVGTRSNRFGLGARIRVEVERADGSRRSIYKWMSPGGSFGSNPLRVEIGLGDAARVVALEVYWPTSDQTQTFSDVELDRWYEITEGASAPKARWLPVAPGH